MHLKIGRIKWLILKNRKTSNREHKTKRLKLIKGQNGNSGNGNYNETYEKKSLERLNRFELAGKK